MGKIQIVDYTKKPISYMGSIAGICWNADTKDGQKNYSRGLECIKSNHGRVMEYADITVIMDEYSARVVREFYTSQIGNTKLQASTRYVNYENFGYYIPKKIEKNEEAKQIYKNFMKTISATYKQLLNVGIEKEDAANILPLGSHTKVVIKMNTRMIMNMCEVRECSRAYEEFRILIEDLKNKMKQLDNEWEFLSSEIFVSKCVKNQYCDEKYSCGKILKKVNDF